MRRTHGGALMIPAVLLAVLSVAVVGGGCALTGISRDQEISLGQQTAAQINQRYRTYTDPQLTQLGQRLAAVSGQTEYPYSFRVIEMEGINAFALPGGPIYVTREMLQFTRGRPEQLAAVLAHEIAHVARRHTAEQIQRQAWLGLGIDILTGGSSTAQAALTLAANLEELGFSRNQERDADRYGAVYLQRAGINPEAMVNMLQRLGQVAGGGGFFSTHPSSADRVQRLQEDIRNGTIARLAANPNAGK